MNAKMNSRNLSKGLIDPKYRVRIRTEMFKPLTGARPAARISAALIILAIMASTVFAGLSYAASPAQAPPPPPPPPLGSPTGLTAIPGSDSGEVLLNWTPAVGATLHIVYLIKIGGDDGRYWPASAGDADAETATGLEPGQEYLFIVIAGREQSDDGSFQWSKWSNWARGRARTLELPQTPPSTPASTPGHTGRDYEYAEIEGVIVSLNTAANTFTMNVREYEHFGGTRPQNPVTVDYASVESVESWLRTGRYVETEGTYYPANNVLIAYEVEADGGDDDDRDDGDNGDGDDDHDHDGDDDDDDDDDDDE